MFNKNSKIFLAGHNGMVGSSIYNLLKTKYKNIITIDKKKLNLLNQQEVYRFIKFHKPNFVINAAARVGGVLANYQNKPEFIYENITIQTNLIHGSYISGVKNFIFLGSSCVYPKNVKNPIKETSLLSGKLENTNDAYAIAKISGIKMCGYYSEKYNLNYKTLMPCNMYGPKDNYNLQTSHFFPALIRKVHEIKTTKKNVLKLWGTGKPRRELMYVGDFALAVFHFMKMKTKENIINIGTGIDQPIRWYANFIMKELNCKKQIKYNKQYPDGIYRKLLDISVSKKYKWKPLISLKEGLKLTYSDFLKRVF